MPETPDYAAPRIAGRKSKIIALTSSEAGAVLAFGLSDPSYVIVPVRTTVFVRAPAQAGAPPPDTIVAGVFIEWQTTGGQTLFQVKLTPENAFNSVEHPPDAFQDLIAANDDIQLYAETDPGGGDQDVFAQLQYLYDNG